MLREHAYKVVQTHAMQSWETGGDFRAAIESDEEIRKYLTLQQIERSFSLDRQLRNVDAIFARVFSSKVDTSTIYPRCIRVSLVLAFSQALSVKTLFQLRTFARKLMVDMESTTAREPRHSLELARVLVVDDDLASQANSPDRPRSRRVPRGRGGHSR